MVIDGQVAITGSFNFTKAAEEKNTENLLIIEDSDLAAKYAENWATHRHHSDNYTRENERRRSKAPSAHAGSRIPSWTGAIMVAIALTKAQTARGSLRRVNIRSVEAMAPYVAQQSG